MYGVQLSDTARKDLKKIDNIAISAKIIMAWLRKNLEGCYDPRQHGKALRYDRRNEWCYRVGTYRLIADIQDNIVTIDIISIGHRREVYK